MGCRDLDLGLELSMWFVRCVHLTFFGFWFLGHGDRPDVGEGCYFAGDTSPISVIGEISGPSTFVLDVGTGSTAWDL